MKFCEKCGAPLDPTGECPSCGWSETERLSTRTVIEMALYAQVYNACLAVFGKGMTRAERAMAAAAAVEDQRAFFAENE